MRKSLLFKYIIVTMVVFAIFATTNSANAAEQGVGEIQKCYNIIRNGGTCNSGSPSPAPGGGGSTPSPTPAPTPPPPPPEYDFISNGVTIKSTCSPLVGQGATLVCPKGGVDSTFRYLGGADPSVTPPNSNPKNIGVWQNGIGFNQMCGVKSKPGSPLTFQGEDKVWILPNCPEISNQVLLRLGAECASTDADFVNNVKLQVGSQSYCIQYMKAFFKIVLLKEYFPMTWQDPDGVYDANTKTEVEAFQRSMGSALEKVDFNSSENQAAKAEYIAKGMAVNGTDNKLTLPVTGKFEKAEWSWLTVFTYLFILDNNKSTYSEV